MSRIVYLNGEYMEAADAKVSIFDRGFTFADGVYEGIGIVDGVAFDALNHMNRLKRSLKELEISLCDEEVEALPEVWANLIHRNDVEEGLVYLQVTRGAPSDRSYMFPSSNVRATVVLFVQRMNLINNPVAKRGQAVITIPDNRWGRRDIKTIQLLTQSLGKNAAKAQGCDDAWLYNPSDDMVNEACSANAHIITREGALVTRQLSTDILHGITRAYVLHLANDHHLTVQERSFTRQEAYDAKEAFVTSSSVCLRNPENSELIVLEG
ncbi:D-alanine transaminase [Sphaeroforma arctica JP610]|uniref:D-alanine transaminase n=1 Tax=Sphaeroforma arctica JP610 TaxID=667725 RepID=A0A0L0FKA6_9EUKA|nr:D-alanine transaminase [Sphaeroforma arctica JP610]KNC76911.1 D-alanine transaminase [Sphaeroforma arctica JP610]|eukprot:XP_014150813.1 D-alanine transaminase [Sphaeroforma arctica JP610]